MRDVGASGYEDIITLIGLTSTPRDGAAVWMAACARGRGAMLTTMDEVREWVSAQSDEHLRLRVNSCLDVALNACGNTD